MEVLANLKERRCYEEEVTVLVRNRMPTAEYWLPKTLKEEAWLAQDLQRPSVRKATFSSPDRPSVHETDHSKALTTLIGHKEGEASPNNMQVQKLGHQHSGLNLPAGSALVASRP